MCNSREQGRNILYPHEFYLLLLLLYEKGQRTKPALGGAVFFPSPHVWIYPSPRRCSRIHPLFPRRALTLRREGSAQAYLQRWHL